MQLNVTLDSLDGVIDLISEVITEQGNLTPTQSEKVTNAIRMHHHHVATKKRIDKDGTEEDPDSHEGIEVLVGGVPFLDTPVSLFLSFDKVILVTDLIGDVIR